MRIALARRQTNAFQHRSTFAPILRQDKHLQTLKLDGTETYDVVGLDANIKPQQDLTLQITRKDGAVENVNVRCRIDTPIEIDYYQHGGILPYVLRQLVARA